MKSRPVAGFLTGQNLVRTALLPIYKEDRRKLFFAWREMASVFLPGCVFQTYPDAGLHVSG